MNLDTFKPILKAIGLAMLKALGESITQIAEDPDAIAPVMSRSAEGIQYVKSLDELAKTGLDKSGEDNFTKYPIILTKPNTDEVVEAFIQDIQSAQGVNEEGSKYYEVMVSLLLNNTFLPEVEISNGVVIHKKCIAPQGCQVKWEDVHCTQINWIDGSH